jgi:ribosomal protein L1
MNTVRKDIKEKIERMEKLEREKRKNENIHLIIAERDFFRQEAMRLNQLCKGKPILI